MIHSHRRIVSSIFVCCAMCAVCVLSGAEAPAPTGPPKATNESIRYHTIAIKTKLGHRRAREKPLAGQTLKAIKELFAAKTYDELIKIPPRWRKEFSRAEFPILVRELARNMGSRRPLLLSKPDYVLIAPHFGSPELTELATNTHAGKPGGFIPQDVYIEGGRCAYALSMLFYLPNTLLPVWNMMSDEDLAYAVRENTFIILDAMATPDEIDFPDMNAQQRERLAAKTRHFEILQRMQFDPEPKVRLALAKRPEIGVISDGFLHTLTVDSDPEVREAATKSWRMFLHETMGQPLDK